MAHTDVTTQPAARTPPAGPVRWKLWLLLATGVYPIITALELLAEPLLRRLPTCGQLAVVVPVMVAVMVWVVLPRLHRWFGDWLAR